MSERQRWVVVGAALCWIVGCGEPSSPEVGGDETSSGGAVTSGEPTSGASTMAPQPTSDATATATGSTTSSVTEPPATGPSSSTSSPPDGTTEDEASGDATTSDSVCGAALSETPEAVLVHHDQPLIPTEQTFIVECGGQGAFMFDFHLEVDGFDGEFVSMDISMDVQGFNVGPSGLFYEESISDIYAGCDPRSGPYVNVNRIIIIPPDEIADVAAMDGASVDFEFVLTTAFGTELRIDSSGSVATDRSPQWNCCSGQGECPG